MAQSLCIPQRRWTKWDLCLPLAQESLFHKLLQWFWGLCSLWMCLKDWSLPVLRVVISEGLLVFFLILTLFHKVSWEQLVQRLVWKSSTDWLVQSIQTSFFHMLFHLSMFCLFFCFVFFLWDSWQSMQRHPCVGKGCEIWVTSTSVSHNPSRGTGINVPTF